MADNPPFGPLGDIASAFAGATTTADGLSEALKVLNAEFDEHKSLISGAAAAYGSLYIAQEVMGSKAYQFLVGGMEKAAQVPKLIAAEAIGSSVLLSEHITKSTDAMTQNALAMQRAAYADQQELAQRQIKIGEDIAGVDITLPMTSFFKNAADLGKSFYDGAIANTRLYSAAVKATTDLSQEQLYRLKETSELARRGLDLDVKTIGALYQEEFSKTGKISGDTVEKFSATILAAAKETGIGTRQLSADMMMMVQDVEHFGNMSYAQMTSLSSAIHQLGLDMNDVTAVAGKFTSFENASQAIANIGAVTGATLDTMEMFYLANEDKEEFFRQMRQNLLDQGVSLENLSHQEQVYLSKQLGFSSVRQLQSLLNEEIDFTAENMTDKIAAAAESQENVGDKLTQQLAQAGGLAKDTLAALEPGAIAASLDAIRQLTGGTSQLADAAIQLRNAYVGVADEALDPLKKSADEFSKGFVTAMKEANGAITALEKYLEEFVKTKVPNILKGTKPESVPPIWRGFTDGVAFMRDDVSTNFAGMSEDMQKSLKAGIAGASERMIDAATSAHVRFDELRDKYKNKRAEIDKIESDLAADQEKRVKEATAVEREFKNAIGFTDEARKARIQAKLGGEGKALSKDEIGTLVDALDAGNADAVRTVVLGKMSERIAAAEAQFKGTAPAEVKATTPSAAVPGASPAGAAATAPAASEPSAAGAMTPSSVAGGMEVKVKLDLDKSALTDFIRAEVVEAITGGIEIKGNIATGGVYTLKLEPKTA